MTLGGIFIYTFISGADEPIVRASIMGLIALIAQLYGRDYTPIWALGITCFAMLLFNPMLVSNVSFLLSVSSTLGIITIGAILEERVGAVIQKGISLIHFKLANEILKLSFNLLSADLFTTLSATICTLPIIMIYFDRISLFSIIANLAVLWVVPPIMLLGGITLISSYLSKFLAMALSFLSWPFLKYFELVINWFYRYDSYNIDINGLNWWFGFGYYLILFSFHRLLVKKAHA